MARALSLCKVGFNINLHTAKAPILSQCLKICRNHFSSEHSYTQNESALPHPAWSREVMEKLLLGQLTEESWLNRIIFLETVAGVPGQVAATLRHFRSLRKLQADQGWIHTLLEEAENERMHLLMALELKQPGKLLRGLVHATQFGFTTFFLLSYTLSPKFSHRLVGYLEEEAVKTYTKILQQIDIGKLPKWHEQKPTPFACQYWSLPSDATMRDMILAYRADEAHHREVRSGSLITELSDYFSIGSPIDMQADAMTCVAQMTDILQSNTWVSFPLKDSQIWNGEYNHVIGMWLKNGFTDGAGELAFVSVPPLDSDSKARTIFVADLTFIILFFFIILLFVLMYSLHN